MGKGNFRLYNHHEECNYPMVYIPIDENENEVYHFFIDDVCENIRSALPDSFRVRNKDLRQEHSTEREFICEVARNGMVSVCLFDNEWSIAVVVSPLKNLEHDALMSLARLYTDKLAKKLFDRLSEVYNLKIRCCAWTSGNYEVSK